MRLHRSALLASVAPLVLAFTLASCGGGGDTPTTPPGNNGGNNPPSGGNPPTGGGGNNASVNVVDNAFTPNSVTIPKGGTVTWTWTTGYGTAHNVTFSDTDSGNKTEGSWPKTFPNSGTFGYQCTNHPGMTGTVIVSP
jgi:plastocyanin